MPLVGVRSQSNVDASTKYVRPTPATKQITAFLSLGVPP